MLLILLLLLLLLILLLLCEGTLLLMVGEVGCSQAVGGTALVGALVPVKVLAQIWGASVEKGDVFGMVEAVMSLGDGGGEECGGSVG